MEKITLKLSEFYQLEAELNGLSNQQTGEVISKISSRDEFSLALFGYRNLENIYYDHLEWMPKEEIHLQLDMLVKNSFATLDEAQELKDLKLLW